MDDDLRGLQLDSSTQKLPYQPYTTICLSGENKFELPMNNHQNVTTAKSSFNEQRKQSIGEQLLGEPNPSRTIASTRSNSEKKQIVDQPGIGSIEQGPFVKAQESPSTNPMMGRRGSLRDDSIEDKKGNYIISFGRPASGKTTFQSFLLYYLMHSGEFKSNLVIEPEKTATGWDAQRLYNRWIEGWQRGEFPTRTDTREDSIRELTLSVTPKVGNKTNLNFSFLEVSGELMEKILPTDESDPILPKTLVRYLENSSITFSILLFINPETAQQDDQLFDNLFTYLDINFPRLRDQISLGVVISKPESSLAIFKKNCPGYSHHAYLKGDLCEDYLERMTPRLFHTLNSWANQEKIKIMTMSLGEIEYDSHQGTELLVRKDFNDVQKTFGWIYKQFSGEALGLTWWQKMFKWIRE